MLTAAIMVLAIMAFAAIAAFIALCERV